jgi:amino acid adenylation domain-containing protein
MTKDRSDLLASLSPEKRALLMQTLRRGAVGQRRAIAPRAAGVGPLPPSRAQRRLWLFEQLRPGSCAYNECSALHLEGDLDVAALDLAIQDILRRHEALRTAFRVIDGAPTQVIDAPGGAPLSVVDLTALPPSEQPAGIERVADREARRPFELTRGPLIRVSLLRLESRRHVLLVVAHHIVLDGWSIGIFQRELTQHYNARRANRPAVLDELPIQYADYALWQHDRLAGAEHDADLAYWRRQLDGMPPVLELPFARARPELETLRGASERLGLDRALCQDISRLAREEGTTLFSALLAGFLALLHRYTGRSDLAVGTVVANRNQPEIEPLIGFFVNTLVLRTTVEPRMSFRQLIRRTHDVTAAAQDHQECPFEDVVDALRPERSTAYNPLFQVMFILQNTPKHPLALHGLEASQFALPAIAARYDLTLSLDESDDGCSGHWEYNADLFEAATIARMTGHLATLLRGLADHADRPIADIAIVTAAERQQLARGGNQAEASAGADDLVHVMFERQATRTPGAAAVAQGDQVFTYRWVDDRATAVVDELRALGVGPGSRVGVLTRRSADMIAALLGILKAGAAYVPLDPGYPQARLSYMLDNASVDVLVAHEELRAALPSYAGRVVSIGNDPAAGPARRAGAATRGPRPEHPAYVIYTSGSSGAPKGVVVSHRNLASSTLARWAYYRERIGAFLLASSIAFDSSVAGMFWTLTQGGTLVLPEGETLDVPDLCRTIARRGVTHILCIPSVYELILDQAANGELASLRTAIVAGEACPVDLPERHRAVAGQARLFNEYGPTEATVWSTVEDATARPAASIVPIGRAIPGARVYVLDAAHQLVPIGVPGELHVGGAGVALGYHGAPELTAEKFIPDPFAAEPGARLYRTGDRARYLEDGALEFLGRVDDQVKIRGVRIELGEVEAALQRHPAVREAAATVHGEGDHKRLIAYVALDAAAPSKPSDLRDVVARQLPSAAVPAEFVVLPSLPRLPNGKLDRKALPAPVVRREQPPEPAAADWSDAERAIGAIWRETLQIGTVGLDDDFFQIGGDSLSAIRVFNRLHEISQAKLAITDLFKHRTIRTLAAMLSTT